MATARLRAAALTEWRGGLQPIAIARTCCDNPTLTCNEEFYINLKSFTKNNDGKITFTYEVSKNEVNESKVKNLSHFVISLTQIDCLYGGYKISDLVKSATLNGESVTPEIGLDPTTQVNGVKIDVPVGSGPYTFTITFDTSILAEGYTLGVGCVLAATKAGNQDITRNDRGSPGYACIQGPVCEKETAQVCWKDETAWAAGNRYVTKGNWATYTLYDGSAKTVTLYAGQTYQAGTVAFSAPVDGKVTITVTLNEGFRFDPDSYENLKVQDYATAPGGNPSPGHFAHKKNCQGTPCTIEVPVNNYYGVHVDVERTVPCE